MGAKHLTCRSCRCLALLIIAVLSAGAAVVGGCGTKEVIPPRVSPSVSLERYEQVEVRIDGAVVSKQTMLRAGQDFDVTVSFRRKVTWPDLDNKEASIDARIMDGNLGEPVINRDDSLRFRSDQNGLLTFAGRIEGLRRSGVYGFWVRENAVSETLNGINRYFLHVSKIRVTRE